MHCVSTYPMEDTDANLNCIHMLRKDLDAMLAIVGMK